MRNDVRGAARAGIRLVILALLAGCGSSGTAPPATKPETIADPYLLEPMGSYPLAGPSDLAEAVTRAYGAMRFGTDPAEAAAAAREVLEQDPEFHPAELLLAQVEHLAGDDAAAAERLGPVVEELPDYRAAQLLLGRAAELSGDVSGAYQAFSGLADVDELAASRVEELEERALQIVLNRLEDKLSRGWVEEAESELAWLEQWAPGSRAALEGARLVAVENDDPEAELAAIRQLVLEAGELEHRQREAELEVEIGDLRSGLEKLEGLVAELPEDPALAESLAQARFLWRLQLFAAGGPGDRA